MCAFVFSVSLFGYLSTGNTKRDSYKDVQLLFSAVDVPCSYSLKEKLFSQREIILSKRNYSLKEKLFSQREIIPSKRNYSLKEKFFSDRKGFGGCADA